MNYTLYNYYFNGDTIDIISYTRVRSLTDIKEKTYYISSLSFYCREMLLKNFTKSRYTNNLYSVINLSPSTTSSEIVLPEIRKLFPGYNIKNSHSISFYLKDFSKCSLSLLLFLLTRTNLFSGDEIINWNEVIENIILKRSSEGSYSALFTAFGLKLFVEKKLDIFNTKHDDNINGIATGTNNFLGDNIDVYGREFIEFARKYPTLSLEETYCTNPVYASWGQVEDYLFPSEREETEEEIVLEW